MGAGSRVIARIMAITVVLAILGGVAAGCTRPQAGAPGKPAGQEPQEQAPAEPGQPGEPVETGDVQFPKKVPAWPAPAVKPVVAPYTVKSDLSNVENLAQFGSFTADQKSLLAKNGFFVSPTMEKQLFYIYENNEYLLIPSFISVDSVLQVYHVIYDSTLRNMEARRLYPAVKELTDRMYGVMLEFYHDSKTPKAKAAALKAAAYFETAARLLGMQRNPKFSLPAEMESLVARETTLALEAQGRAQSNLFPYMVDYSQCKARGHYTRSDDLKAYFRGMMWYGNVPVALETAEGKPDLELARVAALICLALRVDPRLLELWNRVYEPTSFFAGKADDLTPVALLGAAEKASGKGLDPDTVSEKRAVESLVEEARKLPGSRIKVKLAGIPGGLQFRFMGQRYIADSEVLQNLSKWPERPFPKGLDVMAAMGSTEARTILFQMYKEPIKWPDYAGLLEKETARLAREPESTWQSDLYWGWLWAVRPLLESRDTGYPSFMRNTAWEDKSLNTALAGWAELRHDTILYGKQSGAECGGDEPPPLIRGYVEPQPEFYSRLRWLVTKAWNGLGVRGVLTESMSQRLSTFEQLLGFLERMSIKELEGQPLTREEYTQIRMYGAFLEELTASLVEGQDETMRMRWFEVTDEGDKDMAVIADVHTSQSSCLEEGVGRANEIFVVVPIEGKLYLTRGAVFSYHEFVSDRRLTDEEWRSMLDKGEAPGIPPWTGTFLAPVKAKLPVPATPYNSGC
ncbi:MAG: DUF3160 domain-containing protein [Firmicutes bacterium]|nr:DUF3160 domain-containing protein [Bacillota bacterium]